MSVIKRSTGLAGAAFTLTLLAAPLVAASPAVATPTFTIPSSCGGVLQGADSGLINKTITSVADNNDGSFTINFTFTSTRPDGSYRLRDCAFTGADVVISGSDNQSYSLTGGAGSGSLTVPGVSGQQVCDRLGLSGSAGGVSFTDKSNVACVTLGSNPVPAGSIGGLGVAGLGAVALGGAMVYRRRRASA